LSVEKSATDSYRKYLKSQAKEEETVSVKAADNGKFYLQPGKYIIEVVKDGQQEKIDFEIFTR